jgi:hypothetical protein
MLHALPISSSLVKGTKNEGPHYAILYQVQIFSSAFLFSNMFNPCSSFRATDQVSHPYKTGKIILSFTFLDRLRIPESIREIF